MAKDRRSRDQKRRDKLARKRRQSRQNESLAYMGDRYKTKELIHTLMNAEVGIYESFVMTERQLLDQTVASAVEKLIKQMRAGTLPPLPDTGEIHIEAGNEENLVIENIRRNWARHFATKWRPPRDQRIGVLRTILGSIERVRSPSPRSQSYMHHIAGFLTGKLGVKVEAFSPDMEPLPEPEEDELLPLGRRWTCDGDESARGEFIGIVSDLMKNGQAERVLDCCHELLAEDPDTSSDVVTELTDLIHQARRSLMATMN